MLTTKLSKKVLGKLEKNISTFVGKIVDISTAPSTLSTHLDIKLAKHFGVTQKQLSVQIAEDFIRKLASTSSIQVICIWKEQVKKNTDFNNLIESLRAGRIILLK